MNEDVSLRAKMDQFGAATAEVAPSMGQYWRALFDAGVPADVATVLIRDFHAMFWQRVMPAAADK